MEFRTIYIYIYAKAAVCRCSLKFCILQRKAPVLESLFNKIAGLKICNFIKKRLQRKYFPVKFTNFLTTLFLYRTGPVVACIHAKVGKALVRYYVNNSCWENGIQVSVCLKTFLSDRRDIKMFRIVLKILSRVLQH